MVYMKYSIRINSLVMRRKRTLSMSDALKEYRKEMNIDQRLKQVGLVNSWENIVGNAIARRTSKVYMKDGRLFVHLNSSVVRNELQMIKGALIERLNESAGEELVKEIVLK